MELRVIQPDANPVLPPLYGRWMDTLLGKAIPPETVATCSDCAMCAEDEQERMPSGYYFDPGIKCCSFIPDLPNFLVGRVLADDDAGRAAGRATVEQRIADGVAVTPLNLGRHPTYQALYQHVTNTAGFGRDRTIRCPHYLDERGGLCGIWPHRESTCTTWFCKHVRGATGKHFWATLQQLLQGLETELAFWCVLKLDLGREAVGRLFTSSVPSLDPDPKGEGRLTGVPDRQVRQANWGRWAGRERDFYMECARLVEPLSWADVEAICGPRIRAYASVTVDAFEQLTSSAVPPRLRVATFKVLLAKPRISRIESYSSCDPVTVPNALLDLLHYFDGRPTDEVVKAIEADHGVEVEESLVRKLVDFRILTAC
ncbi:MAG: hypothetical protein HY718_17680 [Planctomycetes bacterium]|nr:hypothetical protein [Planctomycetota bacterium]